jgi:hypothetical protein
LLSGSLIRPTGFLGPRQHLAELVLAEQLVRFQMLEGISTPWRSASLIRRMANSSWPTAHLV